VGFTLVRFTGRRYRRGAGSAGSRRARTRRRAAWCCRGRWLARRLPRRPVQFAGRRYRRGAGSAGSRRARTRRRAGCCCRWREAGWHGESGEDGPAGDRLADRRAGDQAGWLPAFLEMRGVRERRGGCQAGHHQHDHGENDSTHVATSDLHDVLLHAGCTPQSHTEGDIRAVSGGPRCAHAAVNAGHREYAFTYGHDANNAASRMLLRDIPTPLPQFPSLSSSLESPRVSLPHNRLLLSRAHREGRNVGDSTPLDCRRA
jgi:hypothetical protein